MLVSRKYLLAILSPVIFILVNACSPAAKTEAPRASTLDSTLQVPESELSVPIFYPLADLEALVNGKLENKIIEANIAIDEKKRDSLFLTITRFKPVDIDYDGTRGITCSVPLKISGLFDTKVAGIKVKNKTPVEAMVIITVFT
jgi:hypothetical protein